MMKNDDVSILITLKLLSCRSFLQHEPEGDASWKVPANLQTSSKPVQPPRNLYKMELETATSGIFTT